MDPAVIELLKQGGVTMALGLGVVFSLLSVLVFAVYGMSYLAGLIEMPLPVAAIGDAAAADDSDVVVAITAAVHAHRNRTGLDG
jgi:sodium pump decarboxylase gamma subunit